MLEEPEVLLMIPELGLFEKIVKLGVGTYVKL
jgi:hypothetical protein